MDQVHNRLTHSLEVARFGRSLGMPSVDLLAKKADAGKTRFE
jgi:dGTP triphosphohydrolase